MMQLATMPSLLAAVLLATAAPVPAQDARTLFSPEGRLLTEGRIFSFACDDLNGDGRPDLVVSDYLNPSRVLFNDAEQRFARVVAFTTTPEMADSGHGVAVADLNGDKRLDLFLVYNEERPSRVLFGDGKGGFTDSGQAIGGPGLFGTAVRVADVDGDGDQDVWVTYFREKARLYLNDGKGAFALSDQVLDTANAVTLGDLDRDGDIDVVSLPPGGGGPATVWLNTRGRFARQEGTLDVGRETAATRPIDIDGDGDLDLLALARTGQSTLWENDGRGSFRLLEQRLDFGTQAAVGDIDGDGDQDLVIRGSVWLNAGGGRFAKAQTLDLGGLPTGALLVDLDTDGDLDLLATRGSRETGKADVFLYLNTAPRSSTS